MGQMRRVSAAADCDGKSLPELMSGAWCAASGQEGSVHQPAVCVASWNVTARMPPNTACCWFTLLIPRPSLMLRTEWISLQSAVKSSGKPEMVDADFCEDCLAGQIALADLGRGDCQVLGWQ